MIEHDMGVVMDISHRVPVLGFGRKSAEGLPDDIMNSDDVKKAYLGEDVETETATAARVEFSAK